MSNERRVYQEDFKRNALELLEASGRRGADVARELGIVPDLLNRWRREALHEGSGEKAFTGHGVPRDTEMARLQKENAELREANDILKKAVAIFSLQGPRN